MHFASSIDRSSQVLQHLVRVRTIERLGLMWQRIRTGFHEIDIWHSHADSVRPRLPKHVLYHIETDHLARRSGAAQTGGDGSWAAADVEHPHARAQVRQ